MKPALVRSFLALSLAAASALVLVAHKGRAATPSAGTISNASGPVAWDFAPVAGATAGDQNLVRLCPPAACDNFDLTIVLPAAPATFYATNTAKVTLKYTWTSPVAADLDIFAIAPNGALLGPGSPDDVSIGAGEEVLVLTDPTPGVWHIRSAAFTVPTPTAAHTVATLTIAPRPTVPPPPPPGPLSATFVNYPAPENIPPALGSSTAGQHGAGEPSIGVNWKTGKVLYEAGNHTLRIAFNDLTTPATATWADKRSPYSRVSLDPILFTDSTTGRTFASQLDGACSVTSYTDDDGETWAPSQGCGLPAGVDHQTLGGGAYAAPAPPLRTAYPHAIYYCSQSIAAAFCARSDDGGVTFGPGITLYTFASTSDTPLAIGQCGGLHGHVKVAPDGTAYVPNHNCKDAQLASRVGVAVSTDNGMSWTVRTVPDSNTTSAGGDPSVGIGARNTVYLGYANSDGHAKIAVSQDRGATWSKSKDAGVAFGIQNTEFPEVVAGDDDRAGFAFLGTTTPGDPQAATFAGVWHLYVAATYDGGRTWTTSDATPADPVQRGCIWNGGGSNQCRNLLDFNDLTIDRYGRMLIGYADGCTGACVKDPTVNTFDALATVARQTGGRGLFAAYDGTNFGVGGPEGTGGGAQCSGSAATGVSGDPTCNDHDSDD